MEWNHAATVLSFGRWDRQIEIQYLIRPKWPMHYSFKIDEHGRIKKVAKGQWMKKRKLLQKLISGSKNIRFTEACACAEAFRFRLSRINGDHHIYVHPEIPELVNLQNVGGKAKPYQVKQLLQIIEQYNLQLEEEE